MKTKTAEIHLGYFKQGDDMHQALEKSKDVAEALETHSDWLQGTSEHLLAIKKSIDDYNASTKKTCEENEISIHADTHYIGITGPAKFINKLIKDELATAEENFDE